MSFGKLVNEADVRLRDWLDQNASKPGSRIPSERALATLLGLQHYAINRAMSRLIAEGRMERDGYKLSVATQKRGNDTHFTCHLVVARRSIHLASYKRVAKDMGIRLEVHSWQSTNEAVHILEQLDPSTTDAVVFDPPYTSSATLWHPITSRLTRQGVPVIMVNQPSETLCSVMSDGDHDLQLAISHLIGLGHRRIGLVSDAPTNPLSVDMLHAWENICRRRGLVESAERIHVQHNATLKEEARETALLLGGDWRDVTGLVVFSGLDYNVQQLQDQLVQHGRHVPKDLSLIFVGGAKSPATCVPPVASVTTDMALIEETAFHLAQRAARKRKVQGVLPPPACLRMQSQLHVRSSTRPLGTSTRATEVPPLQDDTTATALRSADSERDLDSYLRKPYPLAAKASLSERDRFAPVNLADLVNRPLNFRRGWLGDLPLKHFTPGAHEIHGVPFNILGGPRRSDCGAIVLHSAVNTTGNSQPLPDRIRIPIGCKAKAVYVLHGCGYAKFMHAFARYDFKNKKTTLGSVPLVSLGQPPHDYDPAAQRKDKLTPNIQDWWPDFPHMDFPSARMAPILEGDETGHLQRRVFLYTLEWVNPHPEKIVESLEISVDPTLSTTLGVLAVTAVKA